MALEGLWYLLALSIFIEAVTEAIKGMFPGLTGIGARLLSILVALTVCLGAKVGFMSLLGINIRYELIDYALTGIIVSRGSNVTHDVVKKLRPEKAIPPQQ